MRSLDRTKDEMTEELISGRNETSKGDGREHDRTNGRFKKTETEDCSNRTNNMGQ